MNSLRIRLAQWLEGERTEVLANIYPLSPPEGAVPGFPRIRNAAIPAGTFRDKSSGWATFELPKGRYLVEAILPSGETVEQEIELPGETGVRQLELQGPQSPHEWLAWQSFATRRPVYAFAKKADSLPGPPHPAAVHVEYVCVHSGQPAPADASGTSPIDWKVLQAVVDSPPAKASDQVVGILTRLRQSGGTVRPLPASQGDSRLIIHHFDSNGPVQYGQIPPRRRSCQFDRSTPRFLAVVSAGAMTREIAVLPVPWMRVDYSGEASVEMVLPTQAEARPVGAGRWEISGDFLSRIAVRDQGIISVLGYFSSGDLPRAAILAHRPMAMDLLFEKMLNPLAAAAGAYILIAAQKIEGYGRENWHRWVQNLMNWFPTIPDGAILHGWLKLQEGDLESSRKAFLEAFQRGLPFYSIGVRWLLDGLTVLLTEAQSRKARSADLSRAMNAVRTVARHTNLTQPFTVVRIGVRRLEELENGRTLDKEGHTDDLLRDDAAGPRG